ncbi:ABC transporter ATP-binding protein [Ruminococcus flavefaciens]|uniref:ATP-binding cassette, subfamily B n=1 Tax=Ruminococcus flavefaciens TaxID=1265 RepID=A0A1M7K4T4_RUMFL|nr:ABC transporter ATP-binding protein [Ruminococcus flavefaciens]SHM60312.1 ATP-binding cassette, subfamily B [Ruminococcus flavefaciens]
MFQAMKKMWTFSEKRRGMMLASLAAQFIMGMLMITEIIVIIMAFRCVNGTMTLSECRGKIIMVAVGAIIGSFIISYFGTIKNIQTGFYMAADKRISIANTLKNVALGFFNEQSAGRISSVLTTTVSDIEVLAVNALTACFGGFLGAIAIIIVSLFYEWHIGLTMLIGTVVYLMLVKASMKNTERNAPFRTEAQQKLSAAAIAFVQGIKVVKNFSCKNGDEKLQAAIESSRKGNINMVDKTLFSQTLSHLCIAVFETLIIAQAVILQRAESGISIEKAVIIIIVSFMAYSSLHQAGSTLSMFGMLDTAIEAVEQIENTKQLEVKAPVEHIASSKIEFSNVSFSYGENEVLHNVSAVIEPGTCTAVIGPSGSGKTTFCHLIPRFWEIDSGTIKVGEANVENIEISELADNISMVFQRVYLFEDTVYNNICFGRPDATREEVIAAAKAARCDEFISKLPDGYDTLVEENGNNFSGGEKQRISIARAILKDAPIVILDEATSALDPENEKEILEAVDELTKNKTVIMIAHRMNTLKNADHIISVENGRIVQDGTPDELIKQDGIYSRFMRERKRASEWTVR